MKLACGRFRVDGRGAESRSKTCPRGGVVSPPSIGGVGGGTQSRNTPKKAGLQEAPVSQLRERVPERARRLRAGHSMKGKENAGRCGVPDACLRALSKVLPWYDSEG